MKIITLFLLLFTTSCFYISHPVILDPKINTAKSSIGNNSSVNISIEDRRDDKNIIGRRGNGMAKIAPITNNQDLEKLLEDIVIKSLNDRKFKVPAKAGKNLEISLLTLNYESLYGFFTLGSNINAVIEVRVLGQNNSLEFKKIFRSNIEKRHLFVPFAATNQKNINIAFEKVINLMLDDKELISKLIN